MSSPFHVEAPELLDAPYGASRSAWRTARAEAAAALAKMQAPIAKMKDPRAAQTSAAFERILRRVPDLGFALEVLADEESTGGESAAAKEDARKVAQLASYYLRSDRLVGLLRENPFSPLSLDKIFARALQTAQRELK